MEYGSSVVPMFYWFAHRLKHLNLEKNEISAVPQLEPREIRQDGSDQDDEAEEEAPEGAEIDEAAELDKLSEQEVFNNV